VKLDKLCVLEDNLLWFVVATTALGVFVPGIGQPLTPAVTWLLAILMFLISLTFDMATVRHVLRRPWYQVAAALLVYGPMAVAGNWIGHAFFGGGWTEC
jgi:BASS family bile acid:Na+ symporter